MAKGPVLIDLEAQTARSVAEAPPVPDLTPPARGQAMQGVLGVATRRPSRLARWFFGLGAALLTSVLSVAAWDFVTGLVTRNPVLGWTVTGLLGAFLAVLALILLKELAALSRLSKVDALRRATYAALIGKDLPAARAVSERLISLYKTRDETRWARDRFTELAPDQLDAAGLLSLCETELLAPLDKLAAREVEIAAKQVATVTALVPLALADVAAALTANVRMIRRISEVYGGRAGTLGSWRLTRAVLSHMVATGAVAVGDDMLEPILGGSIVGKLSRRFGEGVVNGALTARVGVAAMEVCRPMAFTAQKRPKVRDIIAYSLGGLFKSSKV